MTNMDVHYWGGDFAFMNEEREREVYFPSDGVNAINKLH